MGPGLKPETLPVDSSFFSACRVGNEVDKVGRLKVGPGVKPEPLPVDSSFSSACRVGKDVDTGGTTYCGSGSLVGTRVEGFVGIPDGLTLIYAVANRVGTVVGGVMGAPVFGWFEGGSVGSTDG